MLIAVPVDFGIAIFLTELARLGAPAGRHGDRTARRHSLDHLRHVGPVRARAGAGRTRVSLGRSTHWHVCRCIGTLSSPARRSASACSPPALVLAIMVIPFHRRRSCATCSSPCRPLKESAYALGCTTWEVVWARRAALHALGVIGGIFLGARPCARRDDGGDLRDRQRATASRASSAAPGTSIAATIANEFAESGPAMHQSSADRARASCCSC